MGKPMLMGRRTWDSIGRPLPGRRTLVLTRDRGFAAEGAETVHDWDAALAAAAGTELMVVGGAEIYALALPHADRAPPHRGRRPSPTGDVRFPAFDRGAVPRDVPRGASGRPARRARLHVRRLGARPLRRAAAVAFHAAACPPACLDSMGRAPAGACRVRALTPGRASGGKLRAAQALRPSSDAVAPRPARWSGLGGRAWPFRQGARVGTQGRARTGRRRRLGCLGAIRAAAGGPWGRPGGNGGGPWGGGGGGGKTPPNLEDLLRRGQDRLRGLIPGGGGTGGYGGGGSTGVGGGRSAAVIARARRGGLARHRLLHRLPAAGRHRDDLRPLRRHQGRGPALQLPLSDRRRGQAGCRLAELDPDRLPLPVRVARAATATCRTRA